MNWGLAALSVIILVPGAISLAILAKHPESTSGRSMSVMGLDAAELAGRAGVPLSSAEELVETGLTSIRYVYRMFDLLHIRTETLPSAYAGRLL